MPARPDPPSRALAAEAIGTFALCFVGILAITAGALAGAPGAVSLTTVAFAHGLTIAVMVAALGHHSGAHFNPAVTFGFVATGRMSPARGALYWAAQLGGALLAAGLVCLLFGRDPVGGGTPALAPTVDAWRGVALEAVATFFLVLVVFGTAVDERAPRYVFPLAIGLTVALDIMAIGLLTGAAMNPARAFGPALVSGAWADQWIYWVGPLLGGGVAAVLQSAFFLVPAPSAAVEEHGGPAPSEQRGNS
ncbi:MAG TPA: aquaporin [Longimicrobiaceae bacterium]|nr:aquaporin [Longimicrobiaceae bacterium]